MLDPISFQDADFPHRFAWCWSPLEGKSLRWVPYGMPRLNTRFKHMAFFLYGKNPNTGKVVGPLGTGVFVGLEGTRDWHAQHFYAVTCHHVAVSKGASILRVNTKDGASRFIELEPHEWHFVGGGADLCAADISERLSDHDDFSYVFPKLMASREFLAHEQVEIGEDGFMLGLFADHPGQQQNLVAARFGNLSLLAHENEPIKQPNHNRRPSHIFDMRSRPGFSGSPVFIYRTPSGDLRDHADRGRLKRAQLRSRQRVAVLGGGDFTQVVDRSWFNQIQDDRETESNMFVALLGIHAAQYSERVEARKVRKTSGESHDMLREGDELEVASSMTVVIPAWEITALLDLPVLQAQRHERERHMDRERYKENVPKPESEAERPASSDEDNPNHLEDFTRLVDVAARKRPQGDQT
jgi:hypothetical protein